MSSKKLRNVYVAGKRTSMRLETAFWEGLEEIAQKESLTVGELCNRLAERVEAVDANNLSSAVRVYVLEYFRAATPKPQESCYTPLAIAAE
ncbi:ribbon-helix-helix domain-containing protein [Azospirillum sp. Vi22]|uniref:ribbon-helix-helix domain-containing protein n=1 Tax=Azospirillum baldaniorum TaxID=1064539 RepID=UPI0011A9613A|nr:ribbon-helix-helix domain-containing protein [Azospirillum baldaniorum]NUB08398.1 ribbon-helix-helix domain-containing protein [Azospirillum baldaniorum]TWA54345.1 putative DNA-binding ribbon-helix-helix protein [Azospirillum baldaniorum]